MAEQISVVIPFLGIAWKFYMKLTITTRRRNNPVVRPPTNVVLTVDERAKFAALILVLITIDKKSSKTASNTKGSHKRGPLIFLQGFNRGLAFILLCFIINHHKTYYPTVKHMIDTVVFTLAQDKYHISDPDKFVPSARWFLEEASRAVHGTQSRQNPTKLEMRAGIYKPRLTLFLDRLQKLPEVTLRVEISLSKLLFGNNFQELQGKDLQPLLQKLSTTLATMGVVVTAKALEQAPVSAIHYSKNIPLTDGSTPYHYINKIKGANIQLSLDINQTDYRNEGHSFKWHCNSYEVVFYDKIKDLEKACHSEKRALEKDNALQLNLFDTFANRKKKLEILRMEVRLNKRTKIKQLCKKLHIKSDLTLKSLYKPATAKKVLLHYLDELESKRLPLLDFKASGGKDLLSALIINNPDVSINRILQVYGFSKALETVNARELRVMLAKKNQRSWYRLLADAREVNLPGCHSPFGVIRTSIEKFKPFKLPKDSSAKKPKK